MRRFLDRLVLGWLVSSVVALFLPAVALATITEYPVPTPGSDPLGITAGPDGALWFTEQNNNVNKIGRVTTAGSFSEFPLPTGGVGPYAITAGPDGALWFTEQNANKIGRVTTGGAFSEFPTPTAGSFPHFITAGPDGALWFTEFNANKIGRITTSGSFSEFPVPTGGSGPHVITTGPDGALWFTEYFANKIGRITTAGSFSEFPVPTASSAPEGITAGPDGALWFAEQNANKIGRVTTAGSFSEFPLPTAGSGPHIITAGPDGALWFTEYFDDKIGRVTTAGSFSEFPVPTAASGPNVITAGPDGALWFTESAGNKIGRITTGAPLPGYARPLGATQLRVPLAIAYLKCGDDEVPNRFHGPALEEPSCNPAVQESNYLTVGTDDANSFPAQSVGSVKFTVCPSGTAATGDCSTPAGMTAPDVRFEVNATDVRCKSGATPCQGGLHSDYMGELRALAVFRITDKHNSVGPNGTGDAATVEDVYLPFTLPCAPDEAGGDANAIGAACNIVTRANAVKPGAIVRGKRGNWELGQISVFDGGPDGDADTDDNNVFARQGIFIP